MSKTAELKETLREIFKDDPEGAETKIQEIIEEGGGLSDDAAELIRVLAKFFRDEKNLAWALDDLLGEVTWVLNRIFDRSMFIRGHVHLWIGDDEIIWPDDGTELVPPPNDLKSLGL